jgi:hypothetical protein
VLHWQFRALAELHTKHQHWSIGPSTNKPIRKSAHQRKPSEDGCMGTTHSWSRATCLYLHDPNSTTGHGFIHKLFKAVQSTQVPAPLTCCKEHHKGLHHYEQVAMSRISLVSNDCPSTLPSGQRIRPFTTDKHIHPKATWRATTKWQDPEDLAEQLNPL